MISIAEVHKNTKNLKVLFVEDNIELLKQMQNIFSDLFLEVDLAENGELGLKKFKDKIKQETKGYDLVITDINMPVMNGIEMVKHIYKIIPKQPILITSAHSDAHYLIELLNIGVNGFLIKPLEMSSINKSLYDTARAIKNENLLKSNLTEIENLNKVLSIQSKQLKLTNNELYEKNIALEKSMQISKQNSTLPTTDLSSTSNSIIDKTTIEETPPNVNSHLENIKSTINYVSLKYHKEDQAVDLLKKLSDEITEYINSVPKTQIYSNLNKSLQELSDTVSSYPKCSTNEKLNNVFDTLNSFFFIYTKCQEEWGNIDDNQFENFSNSIKDEINKLIKAWNCTD